MFAGHLAVAFIGKRVAPEAPLSGLVAAGFGLDLIWPVLLLAGLETVSVDPGNTAFTGFDFHSYPWSHSLVAALVWSGIAGALTMLLVKQRRGAWVVAGLVLSHWVLDFVTHRPDLPLWPGGPKVGLGLWHSIGATIVIEGALLAVAVAMYVKATRARDSIGRWALVSMVGLIVIAWLSGPWSPPPPNTTAIAIVTLGLWLLVPWSHWIDAHRLVHHE